MSENYAIIATGGKQYRVRTGDQLDVEKLPYPEGDSITLDDVLLACIDGDVEVGTPTIQGAQVIAKVLAHGTRTQEDGLQIQEQNTLPRQAGPPSIHHILRDYRHRGLIDRHSTRRPHHGTQEGFGNI